MKNLAGFRRKPLSRDISGRMLLRPTRVRAKIVRFHISPHGYAKNAPDFTFPNKDTPKTRPVLGANLRRRTFRGICNTPLHGYVKNLLGFTFPHTDTPKNRPVLDPNRRRGFFQGVCFCAPTRVRAKFGGFHISAHGYAKNAPDFTLPNRDTPKTRPILDPNLCRGVFRGVCNTPLHGYAQNLSGFIFPHTDTPKTYPISSFPIGIHQKRTRFHLSQ